MAWPPRTGRTPRKVSSCGYREVSAAPLWIPSFHAPAWVRGVHELACTRRERVTDRKPTEPQIDPCGCRWYTPCASQGPKQSGPECDVEDKIIGLHKQLKALANLTTVMYWQVHSPSEPALLCNHALGSWVPRARHESNSTATLPLFLVSFIPLAPPVCLSAE